MTGHRASVFEAPGRLALFMRDLFLPWVIPLSARAGRAVQRYRADLDPLSRPTL